MNLVEKKKFLMILSFSVIGILIFSILVFSSSNPSGFTSIQNYDAFGSIQGVNLGNAFEIFSNQTSLSLTGNALTGVTCSLTNNGHLMGIDGSDYKVDTGTSLFNPIYFASVINPYSGATLYQVKFIVYLYCQPFSPTLAAAGYHPYLTGGTLTMQFVGRDPNGNRVTTQNPITVTVSPSQVDIGSNSIAIATFTIPATSIQQAVGTTNSDYYSQQDFKTTGTLYFKQKLTGNQVNAVYSINPALDTSFSVIIKGQAQQCANGLIPNVAGSNLCSQPTQYLYLYNGQTVYDLSKTDQIPFQVKMYGWDTNQKSPVITISNNDGNQFKQIVLSNPATNNGITTWTQTLSIQNDLNGMTGNYNLNLMQGSVSNIIRPAVNQNFVVTNTTPQPQCAFGSDSSGNCNQQPNQFVGYTCPPNTTYAVIQGVSSCLIGNVVVSQSGSPIQYATTGGTCNNGGFPVQTNIGTVCTVSGASVAQNPASLSNYACGTLYGSTQCLSTNLVQNGVSVTPPPNGLTAVQPTISSTCPNGGVLTNIGNGQQQCMSYGSPIAQPITTPISASQAVSIAQQLMPANIVVNGWISFLHLFGF